MLSHDSRNLLARRLALGLLPYEYYSVEQAREMIAAHQPAAIASADSSETIDLGAGHSIAVYRPAAAMAGQLRPAVVYMHGGGWVFGELPAHRLLCRRLAQASGWVVISVAYRLAPEHMFPAAVDDCFDVMTWLAQHHARLSIDARRIVVAGDSAGGTLAAALAGGSATTGIRPVGQMLVYPSLDQQARYDSYAVDVPGMAVTGRTMRWFQDQYLGAEADRSDPRASPMIGDPSQLPPSLVITAGYDPLRDEGELYVRTLRHARVACEHQHYAGELHGFLTVGPAFESSRHALARMTDFLVAISRQTK